MKTGKVHYVTGMIDDPLLSETNVEGSLFDPATMARLYEETHRGLWVWDDWETAMMYRDLAFHKAIHG